MSQYSSPLGIFDASIFPEVLDDPASAGAGGARKRKSALLRATAATSVTATAIGDGASSPPPYESPISAINQELRRKNVVAATTAAAAAAAAAVTSGGGGVGGSLHPSLIGGGQLLPEGIESFSDPWELSGGNGNDGSGTGGVTYHEQSRAALSWAAAAPTTDISSRRANRGVSSEVPPAPGSAAWGEAAAAAPANASFWSEAGENAGRGLHLRRGRSSGSGIGMGTASEQAAAAAAALGEPQHVQALLESTPHLRVLCPASTDMQGGGLYAHQPAAGSPHNVWLQIVAGLGGVNSSSSGATGGSGGGPSGSLRDDGSFGSAEDEYAASLVRDRINQQAAHELAGLMWVLAHEMTLEEYGVVESEVFSAVFSLVHSTSREGRMAGLAAVDALLATPSADEEKKAIKFANTLSNGLRAANGEYEFLSAVSKALGHMARRTANVDFVESEVTRALEWLSTDRSDRRYERTKYRSSGFVVSATVSPLFYSKGSRRA
jgi:hypothetical protein